ncbi:MAG: diphthine synthase [Candidatus Odinarchaeota archaeon]
MTKEEKNGLYFIGTGAGSYQDLTVKGLVLLKAADIIYYDSYTNFSAFKADELAEKTKIGFNKIKLATRSDLEDNAHLIVDQARNRKVALLVPGDPFLATTHNSLRLEAIRAGIPVKVANNANIFSLVTSLAGLHFYKFGRTITLPFPENRSIYPYETIRTNLSAGNHTLILLDIDVSENRFLDISDALKMLSEDERNQNKGVVTAKSLFVGLAKLGHSGQILNCGTAEQLIDMNWKNIGPPQSIIACADLHFSEKEALEAFC